MSQVVIIEYGSGNTRSMENALRAAAADEHEVLLTRDPARIASADHLVLPGVGAFGACVNKLHDAGVVAPLRQAVARGVPTLGVCVGMQVLADEGHEFGTHAGLGLVPGVVEQVQADTDAGFKLPHIAWTTVKHAAHPVFVGLADEPTFYFVHSFSFHPENESDVLATARYDKDFVAAVARGNLLGTQFHPEKSGPVGLKFLKNFMRWTP